MTEQEFYKRVSKIAEDAFAEIDRLAGEARIDLSQEDPDSCTIACAKLMDQAEETAEALEAFK